MVEWLKRRECDRHGLGSKSTSTILLYLWERHLAALFPAWWFWQAGLNFNHISIKLKKPNRKFQADSNILASPEAGRGNCLSYLLEPLSLSCKLEK